MTATSFSTNDAIVVKRWADRGYYDSISDETVIGQCLKDGSLRSQESLNSGAGDAVTYRFLNRLTNAGFAGDQAITGQEQPLTYYTAKMLVDQLRNATQVPASQTISAQRVNFNMDEDSYQVLRNWTIERQTLGLFNQLAGNTATTINWDGQAYTGSTLTNITGMNAAIAPSSTRIIRANGLSTDAAVNSDTTATLRLSMIDEAVANAMKVRPYIEPMDGAIKFKCYVHVDGFRQLINDINSANMFRDIMLSKIAGGDENAALIGDFFDYNNTRIIATDKIPYGVSSSVEQTNTRRAVFMGKGASCIAYGQGFTLNGATTPGFSFKMDTVDIGQWNRFAVNVIFGIQKTQFNSIDHGTIVLTHYVA